MWGVLLAVALLCAIGLKVWPKGQFATELFSREQTVAVKGILALVIVLDHLGAEMPQELALQPFHTVGFLAVGFFFLFSGYGVALNWDQKPHYQDGFLSRRLTAILTPVFFTNLFYLALNLAQGQRYTVLGGVLRVLDVFYLFRLNGSTWYIYSLAAFCIAYYLCARFVPRKYDMAVFAAFLAGWTIVLGLNDLGQMYGMNFCFLAGILLARGQKQVLAVWHKRYPVYLLLFGALSFALLFGYWVFYDNLILGKFLARNIGSVCAAVFFTLAMQKLRFGNPVIRFLGGISMEIYLIHMFWIRLLHSDLIYLTNNVVYTAVVIAASVLSAVPLHWADEALVRFVRRGMARLRAAKE